jgi:hypothetical protein
VAYLGNDLQVAFPTYRNIDDISGSFNGVTTSFPLTVGGVAPIPAPLNSQQCLISVNGVVQRPDDSGAEGFLLSGGNIVFASAPAGGVDFFGVILAGADYINIGANFPSGTALVPSITFDSDLDTGIYNPAGNQIGFTTAGVQRLVINSSGQVSGGLGSATTPAFSFLSDPNTGIYSPGADQVAVATNGAQRITVDSSGRLLVGTSSTRTFLSWDTPRVQIEGTGYQQSSLSLYNNENTVYGAVLALGHSRGTSLGSNTVVSQSDYFGAISFYGSDGSNELRGAEIAAYVDGTPGANDMPGRLVFLTTADGASNPTERMRIDSSGRVGIGTTSVSETLHLKASAPRIRIEDAEGGYSNIEGDGGSLGIYADNGNTQANSFIRFDIDGTEKSRLTSSGQWLVGTSTARSNIARYGADYTPATQIQTNVTSGWGTGLSLVNYSASGYAPVLTFGLSGSNTAGTNTLVASGDRMGVITFNGNDGTNFEEGARIEAQVDGTPGANDMPGRLVFSTTSDGASSPTERLRIDSSGRVGIGTTSPGVATEISSSSAGNVADTLRLNNPNSNAGSGSRISFYTPAAVFSAIDGVRDSGGSGGSIRFNTMNTAGSLGERGRWDTEGRLLVGTSSSVALDNPHKVQIAGSQRPLSMWVGTANSDGAYLSFGKSRNTTYGSYTAVQNGDELGAIAFLGDDGTDYATPGAYIQAFVDGNPGTNDMPGRLVFSTTADGASTPTERMRIASNGFFRASNLGSYNDPVNGNYHEFRSSVNSTIILRVEHTSNVSGNGTFSSVLGSNCDNTSSYHFTANANGDRMRVYGNGNIVNTNNSYGAISDIKLKENIVDANSQWDDLKALQVRNYNFKEGQTHTQIGLVAQEVELVSPGLVTESPDRDEDGNDLGTVTKSVNYSVLYMKAVKALQEAMERIEQLEAKVAALESA